ncbi:MAG: hypothetical protein K0S33_3106 [Bacteroidetes bacterium]|jgi:hypothetical protein|nr:hypothetical protein [Bacteroidota bacterium]
MLKKDFDVFKQKYLADCKTQSSNSCVLELYRLMLEKERVDSDYWSEEHGAADIIRIFENCFTDHDWKELETDLPNWTLAQLELFTEAIMGGYHSYTENGVYYEHYDVESLTKTIPNRLSLLIPILRIEKERGPGYPELSIIIRQNIHFINDHFDIVLRKNPENLQTIQQIVELSGIAASQDQGAIDLKNKIKKAGN